MSIQCILTAVVHTYAKKGFFVCVLYMYGQRVIGTRFMNRTNYYKVEQYSAKRETIHQ